MRSVLLWISGVLLTTTVTAAPASLLPQVNMLLPGVDKQDDTWSCGVNSSARILRAFGHDVTYQSLRAEIGPLTFRIPTIGTVPLAIGWGGKALSERLKKYEPSATWQDYATFSFVRKLLAEGKPVGTLLFLGTDIQDGVVIPHLHWVVLSGFDDATKKISYYDTDTGFGRSVSMPYDEFLGKWQWRDWDIWNGSSGRSFVSQASIFFSNGQSGIFWIDRPLPEAVVARRNTRALINTNPLHTTAQSLSFEADGVDACSKDRAFESARYRCMEQLGLSNSEKVLVHFRPDSYWMSDGSSSPIGIGGAHWCKDHVRDAVCASAATDNTNEVVADYDKDHDGLSDDYELTISTNPAVYDTDGDGMGDGDELAAGRSPTFNEAALIPILFLLGS